MSSVDSSTVGSSTQPMMSRGAPAATAASSTSFAAWQVAFFARGCGEKTMPFRVFNAISALKIAVDVGLVVGTMPQRMPIGSAMVIVPKLSSSDSTPQVCSSLYLL